MTLPDKGRPTLSALKNLLCDDSNHDEHGGFSPPRVVEQRASSRRAWPHLSYLHCSDFNFTAHDAHVHLRLRHPQRCDYDFSPVKVSFITQGVLDRRLQCFECRGALFLIFSGGLPRIRGVGIRCPSDARLHVPGDAQSCRSSSGLEIIAAVIPTSKDKIDGRVMPPQLSARGSLIIRSEGLAGNGS